VSDIAVAFAKWADVLAKLPTVMVRVAPRAAAAFSGLARQSYSSASSVYGSPFVGVAGRLDLTVSGTLGSRATRYTATGTTVRASVGSVRYARYQLKHGFLPARGRLPQAWRDRVDAIVREEIEREISRGGLSA
jgi:hypothetical protein